MPQRGQPNPDADGLDQICWSCRTSIDHRTGLSLTEASATPGSRQICETCWEQIPIVERIKIQWLFRSLAEDGSGIVGLIDDAVKIIREARQNLSKELPGEIFDGDDE